MAIVQTIMCINPRTFRQGEGLHFKNMPNEPSDQLEGSNRSEDDDIVYEALEIFSNIIERGLG